WGATRGELRAGVPARSTLAAAGREGLRDTGKRLEILYQVTEAIRSTFAIEELLEQIIQIIMEVIRPDRAYLLFIEEGSGQLVPEVIQTRDPGDEQNREVKISTSII